MKNTKRFTISGRNLQFLEDLSRDMDEPNLNAVIGYLLTDIRGLGYTFGNKSAPQPTTQRPIGYTFEPAFTPPIQENHRNHVEVDPTIQRLIDAGLEMEF